MVAVAMVMIVVVMTVVYMPFATRMVVRRMIMMYVSRHVSREFLTFPAHFIYKGQESHA